MKLLQIILGLLFFMSNTLFAQTTTVTSSSSYENSGWGEQYLIDGINAETPTAKGWSSNAQTTVDHEEWIQFDLGNVQDISGFELYSRTLSQGFPLDFYIEISENGSNWTTLVTESNYQVNSLQNTFSISLNTARYVRIVGTKLRLNPLDNNQYRMQFTEVNVLATEVDSENDFEYVLERINPANSYAVGDNYLLDFGKAAFASAEFTYTANTPHTIKLHLGEKIENGSVDRTPGGTIRYQAVSIPVSVGTNTYQVSLVSDFRNTGSAAIQMPSSIPVLMPYRYVEVENLQGNLQANNFTQLAYFGPWDNTTSNFDSDNDILNQIWDLCKYSMKATSFMGYYVDGDRERISYESDSYLNQLSHYYSDSYYTIARNTIEHLMANPTWPVEWHQHMPLMFYADYMFTGNTDLIELYYDQMVDKSLYDLRRADGLISIDNASTSFIQNNLNYRGNVTFKVIVDWPVGERDGYDFKSYNTVVNALYYKDLVILSEMAAAIGKNADAQLFAAEAAKVKATFNTILFDESAGVYVDGEGTGHASIHANLFPLAMGLVPEDKVASVTTFIKSKGMACSVYAAQYLMEGLYLAGEEDYALQLMTKTDDRSWYNMIADGSTITTEAWDIIYKSNQDWNHAWGAAPANIIPGYMWGIRPAAPGFEVATIQPQLSTLQNSEVEVPTIHGGITATFQKSSSNTDLYTITIPSGIQGEFSLPQIPTITSLSHNGDTKTNVTMLELSSGTHTIELSSANMLENIALNKPASQSSTGFGGVASRVVDGNINGNYQDGSVSHTNTSNNPWWRVDLGSDYSIEDIFIFNRTNSCCINWLNGAKVFVGDVESSNPSDYTEVGTLDNGSVQSFTDLELEGRYVMVQIPGSDKILSLAEVQVFGVAVDAPVTDCTVDLSEETIQLVAGQGTSTGLINEGGFGITINGNGWNAMELPQTISSETVLSFDFRSTQQGEEHSIGFSNSITSNGVVNGSRFKLYGTQNVSVDQANQNFNYNGSGDWQTFTIPVGEFFTGDFQYLVFVNDNDAAPNTSNSSFRNVKIGIGADCDFGPTGTPNIDYAFNFAPQAVNTPAPFIEDNGQAYGAKTNGLTYGWVLSSNNTPINSTQFTRNRAVDNEADLIRETLMHMNLSGTEDPINWEVAVPNGTYRVVVTGGDLLNEEVANTQHLIKAEGTTVIDFIPGNGFGFRTGVATVTVSDGKLTIDGSDGLNAKMSTVAIQSINVLQYPAIVGSLPLDGATDVSTNTTISANFLSFPNVSANGATSLDNSTLNNDTVKLYKLENDTATPVTISINGTGGGDAINMTVNGGLEENTRYRYAINGAQDLAGGTIFPFAAEFTTGVRNNDNGGDIGDVAFTNLGSQANGFYASLTIGPDGKLYGLRISGQIDRWIMNADGSLSGQETLTGLNNAFGGSDRLAVGLAFAPNSTANNLIAYVSHSFFTFSGGPTWDGKISKLTGGNLQNHELIVTNLPRSVRDHLTNSIVFDPNNSNILYFNQGSNSAGGAADGPWGNRPERLLTAATLRLDLSLLPNNLPLDVQTTDNLNVINNAPNNSMTMSDGTYNPYANNSPLTIAGSGVRNPYDLVFHSNGQIYVPTNGTAGGSNSPASVQGTRRPNGEFYNGPSIPAVNQNSAQRDFLFRINPNNANINYFGHPNPLRGEYVLNSGTTSSNAYPSNIQPDANYGGFAYDFGFNVSPNGAIEYKSAGALQGAIIVCRYSNGDDLIAVYPDGPNGDVSTDIVGVPGFAGLDDPLDLVEDPNTGNIYVSEFAGGTGNGKITLLKLDEPGTNPDVPNAGITIAFSTPIQNQSFDENESIGVVVNATDSNGSISNVRLFLNNTLVRQENFAPYEWGSANTNSRDPLLQNLAAGNYILKAIATDNDGNIAETSIDITVISIDDTIEIFFVAPENNDVYNENSSLGVVVNATDSNGSISNVRLFLNNTLIRQENFAPYEWGSANTNSADPLLQNLKEGSYTLTAIATDNEGNTKETSIDISVLSFTSSNVRGENIFVENMRKIPGTDESFPYEDRVVFHRASTDRNILFSEFSTLRINNESTNLLTVSDISITNSAFELVNNADADGFQLGAGEFKDIEVHFVTSSGSRRILEADLIISSDDPKLPNATVRLAGGYMAEVEGRNELSPQQVTELFGFDIQLTGNDQSTINHEYPTLNSVTSGAQGDLVLSKLWEQADPNQPVSVFMTNALKVPGSSNARLINLNGQTVSGFDMSFATDWHQTIFPRSGNNQNADLVFGTGNPAGQFAIELDGHSTLGAGGTNPDTGEPNFLAARVYRVVNSDGTIRPDEYYAILDYTASRGECVTNNNGISTCDYNDIGLYLKNIKPIDVDEAAALRAQASLFDEIEFSIQSPKQLLFAPNPASDFLNLDVSEYMNQPISYTISTLEGKVVKEGKVDANHGGTMEVRLDILSNGIYFINLKSANLVLSAKFTIVKDY